MREARVDCASTLCGLEQIIYLFGHISAVVSLIINNDSSIYLESSCKALEILMCKAYSESSEKSLYFILFLFNPGVDVIIIFNLQVRKKLKRRLSHLPGFIQ